MCSDERTRAVSRAPWRMRREFVAVGAIDFRMPPENRRGISDLSQSSAVPAGAGLPSVIVCRSSGKEGVDVMVVGATRAGFPSTSPHSPNLEGSSDSHAIAAMVRGLRGEAEEPIRY